jgi:Flp pilus assembly protein CpaB
VLPSWLDRLSDRWWRLSPRARSLVTLALGLAVLAGAGVRAIAAPYGPPTTVLVARDDLAAGTIVDGDTFRPVRWPADLAPDRPVSDATGTLTAAVPAGAVLTEAHVTDDGLGGVVGPGRAAVPLPADLVTEVPVGTRVQVVAAGGDGAAVVLADDAEVVTVDAGSVWLAVDDAAAADVAAAGLRGSVALAVVSGG